MFINSSTKKTKSTFNQLCHIQHDNKFTDIMQQSIYSVILGEF